MDMECDLIKFFHFALKSISFQNHQVFLVHPVQYKLNLVLPLKLEPYGHSCYLRQTSFGLKCNSWLTVQYHIPFPLPNTMKLLKFISN